jgi:ribosomal protein S6
MANLKQFVENNDFTTGTSLPKGDTFLSVNAEIKEIETEFEGKKKIRYEIKESNKTFYVGTKVMEGIKEALNEGFTYFRVTKTGEGMKTNYSVVGVKE